MRGEIYVSPQTHPGFFARRDKNNNCYYMQKEYISRLHTMFNNNLLNTSTTIKIVDSHGAYPYYEKSTNEIVFDTHFLDILRIVTAFMISEDGNESIDELADACSADYYLCKDEIYLALKYADFFSKNKQRIEQLIGECAQDINELFNTQLMFLLSHEQVHGLLHFDKKDNRFIPFKNLFDVEFKRIISIAKTIRAVDLSPIKQKLDQLDKTIIEDDFDYSPESINKLCEYVRKLNDIVDFGINTLNVQETDMISKRDIISYACDMYLKNSQIKLLDRKQYENECICDGYSLLRIISCKSNNEDIDTHIKKCIFAYYSCLLTMNIITCVNACIMNYRMEGYNDEDLVWNRLRLEREIFNSVITQYAFRKSSGYLIVQEMFSYAESLVDKYNTIYARFCDRLFAIEHPTEHTPYCPYGCDEYNKLYDKVCSNLSIDLSLNI